MIKDILNVGLGSAFLAKEKVEEELDRLIERGKVSKSDAKEFLDRAKERASKEEDKFKEKVKEALKEVVSELNLASKEDLEKLKDELKK